MELTAKEENTESADAETKSRKRKNPFTAQRLKEEKQRRQKKRGRLIVRNISYKSTEDVLRKHFEQWGTISDVNILKRTDGKLVGCAFIQYEAVNNATKAILKGNGKELLGRPIYIDWALSKDNYQSRFKKDDGPTDKKIKLEVKGVEHGEQNNERNISVNSQESINGDDVKTEIPEEDGEEAKDGGDEVDNIKNGDNDDEDNKDNKQLKSKLDISLIKKEKYISKDVQEGCTVFIKNVPFDAEDVDLRKVCRKFGFLHYAIINREKISGHSKGTAFVKFKTKESADLCLQAGPEFMLMSEVLEPQPALSREEIKQRYADKFKDDAGKDSRNLYLIREGLIMAGSKAAVGVSASDIAKRNQLEQIKTQVLKNLNRFVSRNRLSIHNLPLDYDNEKLKQMAITYTGFRPHECRVMHENKITPNAPNGKSKGFGFLSFSTHQQALIALRKLNNNPNIFSAQHRPIVAFSIEDRAVHKIKEKRDQRSKLNNPTYKAKLERRKEKRKQKAVGKLPKSQLQQLGTENKAKVQKQLKKLEQARAAAANMKERKRKPDEIIADYVGTAAKPGTALHMRSKKKIMEQTKQHMQRVKNEKRKQKQKRIREMHLAERKADNRPKQGQKVEKDEVKDLVRKYKSMIENHIKVKKPKRVKWYTD